jgi:hypothetical protein
MKARYLLAFLGLAMVFGGWSCGSSHSPGMPGLQIAGLAKQLIETQTSEANQPTLTEDKNLVDGSDPTSFDPDQNRFDPSFFQ